jgi:hypothetical protein
MDESSLRAVALRLIKVNKKGENFYKLKKVTPRSPFSIIDKLYFLKQ